MVVHCCNLNGGGCFSHVWDLAPVHKKKNKGVCFMALNPLIDSRDVKFLLFELFEVDKYPEAAFNLVGTIEEAIEKGEKMLSEK